MSEINRKCPHCGQECTSKDWRARNSMMGHDENGNPFLYHSNCVQHLRQHIGKADFHTAERPVSGCHLCSVSGWIYVDPFPSFEEWLKGWDDNG